MTTDVKNLQRDGCVAQRLAPYDGYEGIQMRIGKGQVVAGYPALTVRAFLRRCRFCIIVPETAAIALKTAMPEATVFLRELASLDLIESAEHLPMEEGIPRIDCRSARRGQLELSSGASRHH